MILTDLLGSEVFGREFLGYVSDARFVLDETTTDQPTPIARLYGLIVSPHARSSSLGFERSGIRSPWPVAALVHWRHRDSFLVRWSDIQRIERRRVQLRLDFTQWSPELSESATIKREWS